MKKLEFDRKNTGKLKSDKKQKGKKMKESFKNRGKESFNKHKNKQRDKRLSENMKKT